MTQIIGLFIIMTLIILFIVLYFLPPIIAYHYKDKNTIWIFVLTLLFGWSTIGWILALLWAVVERDGSDLIEKLRGKM